jgi:hypothetical protein
MPEQLVLSVVDEEHSLFHRSFKITAWFCLADNRTGLTVDGDNGYCSLFLIERKRYLSAVTINRKFDCHSSGSFLSL